MPESNDAPTRPDQGSPPKTPLWVKVFGVIGILVLLLAIILIAAGGGLGGKHGPGRHFGSGDDTASDDEEHEPEGNHTSPGHALTVHDGPPGRHGLLRAGPA